jgi:hypothetical protein
MQESSGGATKAEQRQCRFNCFLLVCYNGCLCNCWFVTMGVSVIELALPFNVTTVVVAVFWSAPALAKEFDYVALGWAFHLRNLNSNHHSQQGSLIMLPLLLFFSSILPHVL